jgi:phosphoribosylformylglycinamidine synthase
MAQFTGCLEGMGAACRALDFPIVSGNVSLYNESKATGGGSAILPTPAIGGVGILHDYRAMATIGFKAEGEAIYLIGSEPWATPHHERGHLGQSLWLRAIHGREDGDAPQVDLTLEKNSGEFVRELIAAGLVSAVHDVSDGGLAVTLAEMALAGGLGAGVEALPPGPAHAVLFGEDQGRYLVTTAAGEAATLLAEAAAAGIPALALGLTTAAPTLTFPGEAAISLARLKEAHEGWLPAYMAGELA